MTKSVTILGSTGSIGRSTLRVLESFPTDYTVYGLACGGNTRLLREQIDIFHPSVVAVGSEDALGSEDYHAMKKDFSDVEFLEEDEGIVELASHRVDITVSAIVGAAGLRPSLAAIESSGRIALANKETLVMAGDIFMERVRNSNVELLPVDSEHSALFLLLENIKQKDLKKIILTASGGSLREHPVENLVSVTPEEALNHPTWDMGRKITIDSATLMNKGFEVIEAHHLFDVEYDMIDVIIHPESVIHSLIKTIDGSIFAHLGVADMAHPILNALTYPEKRGNQFGELDLASIGGMNFSSWDSRRYPALELCYAVGREGGSLPAALNAANEKAVDAFLNKKILFTDIVDIVDKTLNAITKIVNPDLDDILRTDKEAREIANSLIRGAKS